MQRLFHLPATQSVIIGLLATLVAGSVSTAEPDRGESATLDRLTNNDQTHIHAMCSDKPADDDGFPTSANGQLPFAEGFNGIWYANQASDDQYKFKYSGGHGTYPHQHVPIAIHSKEADKTFFVLGCRYPEKNQLIHVVSYYDHKTGMVARPRVLLDKKTSDAHDNPVISIDDDGYIFIFSAAHGSGRPAYIHRSSKPYDISSFDLISTTNFSYPQPWHVKGHGFVFMQTIYRGGRALYVQNSKNGRDWSEPRLYSLIAHGHYQVTWKHEGKVGSMFNYHPQGKGLNWRTNVYYIESDDGGRTFKNIQGKTLDLPLTEIQNDAMALEYESKGRNCYMKCLRYTSDGRPVMTFLTSGGYESGPKNDPRTIHVAQWTGKKWDIRDVTTADNNYDFASLSLEDDKNWRMITVTAPGPQAYNTGGEVSMWNSADGGHTWKEKPLTRNSQFNHNYPRLPVHAHPDFVALWADGHGREQSNSRFYFTDSKGSAIWRLPEKIEGDAAFVKPERIEIAR